MKTWLTAGGKTAKDAICAGLQRRAGEPTLWGGKLVSAFEDAGDRDSATALARRFIADDDITGSDLQFTVESWLEFAGHTVETELRALLSRRSIGSGWDYAAVAQACADGRNARTAVWLAQRALHMSAEPIHVSMAVKAWVTATGPAGAPDLMAALSDRHLTALDRVAAADHLAAAGALATAQQLWREVLTAPASPLEFKVGSAARLVETGADPDAVTDLISGLLPGRRRTG